MVTRTASNHSPSGTIASPVPPLSPRSPYVTLRPLPTVEPGKATRAIGPMGEPIWIIGLIVSA